MPNKYVNKVVIGKETKLDLTADTITPDKLAKGITAHDKSGAPITGTSTKDADTSDRTGQAGAHKYPRGRYGPGRERLYERQRRYEAAGQERYADL